MKKKILIVVDMQRDFVNGSLGTKEAEAIVPAVRERIRTAKEEGYEILFTRDTHPGEYLSTQEGRRLPVEHCIRGTEGWQIVPELDTCGARIIDKPSFGSLELMEYIKAGGYQEAELIGLCTDICVVSNALLLKAADLSLEVKVRRSCCAGVTPRSHEAALQTMSMCQVEILE